VDNVVEGLVEEVRCQWEMLWRERIDDHVRAEGIANRDYDKLFVERGTVVLATRNFKLLTLRDILEMHGILNVERLVQPCPSVGGWGKFVRTYVRRREERKNKCFVEQVKKPQQLKKGGRGWLHV